MTTRPTEIAICGAARAVVALGAHLLEAGLRRIALVSVDGEDLEDARGALEIAGADAGARIRCLRPGELHGCAAVVFARHATGSAPQVATNLRAAERLLERLAAHVPGLPVIVAAEPRDLIRRVLAGDRTRRTLISPGSAIEAARAARLLALQAAVWHGDVRVVALGGPSRALVLRPRLASVAGLPLPAPLAAPRAWEAFMAILLEGRPSSDRESAVWAASACRGLLGAREHVVPGFGVVEGVPSTTLLRLADGEVRGALPLRLDEEDRAALAGAAALMERRAREHGL